VVEFISFSDMLNEFSKGTMLDAIDGIGVLNVALDGTEFDTIPDVVFIFNVV
jgi:hypothetical protein